MEKRFAISTWLNALFSRNTAILGLTPEATNAAYDVFVLINEHSADSLDLLHPTNYRIFVVPILDFVTANALNNTVTSFQTKTRCQLIRVSSKDSFRQKTNRILSSSESVAIGKTVNAYSFLA